MTTEHVNPGFPATDDEWALVARFVAGELSDVEAAAVRRRLGAADDAALLAAIGARREGDVTVDVEAALRRVRGRMDRSIAARPAPARRVTIWQVAAVTVLVAGAGYALLNRRQEPPASVARAPSVYVTAAGRRDSIGLADGTRVLLGPGSRLTVPADYAVRREATLDGQAAFEVTHDPAHPFAVRTTQALVTDIGTRFTVHDVPGAATEVAVQSGTVQVRPAAGANQPPSTLQAGDAGRVTVAGKVTVLRGGASADDRAWESGRLVFRDAPMIRVRAELRRWYGVELVSSDSTLATRHLTASFTRESRREVLDAIALALGARYELRADSVVLSATVRPLPR